ncbi:hypothetical protein EMPS_02085 [Entomortierella parvispora]|uniref:Uncharacterized protein n=1 Tax=Entomortierella parvispora TaxID=205924 RepID=A0A9P3H4R6_9FUNG|nr:hypothetical protein EMPS_02085 [Entomortierella parvispora]
MVGYQGVNVTVAAALSPMSILQYLLISLQGLPTSPSLYSDVPVALTTIGTGLIAWGRISGAGSQEQGSADK